MEYYAAYEVYDSELIGRLCNENDVKGIILGDLFCNRRMFEKGIADLILLINKVLASDKTLVFQAPLYITGRNLSEVKSILSLIVSFDKASYVIVQDFGTAEMIRRDYPEIKLIWGQLGRVRELRFSDDFLGFLSLKGFMGMETGSIDTAARIKGHGLIPFFNENVIDYSTLGRNCYYEYQVGECDREMCRKGNYSLRLRDADFEMSIDGYMLGKKYRKADSAEVRRARDEYGAEIVRRALGEDK